MRLFQAKYIAFLAALVDCFGGCVSTTAASESAATYQKSDAPKNKPVFHKLVETEITVANGEVNAEIFRPLKQAEPKTVVIMVPGAGNVSRKGEVSGDGINTYEQSIAANEMWAAALAERGYFVLSYDKRTCTKSINQICRTNDQNDVERDGIYALVRDLDASCQFVRRKLGGETTRIILMSSTQGAQTIALADCLNNVQGVVLISPIINDLETMWLKGLAHAAKEAGPQRMRLLNQKESMAAFFKSLKAGQFPETSNVRGASVKFWQSWIDASKQTLANLRKASSPSLLLFSQKDSFSSEEIIAPLIKQKSNKIFVKTIKDADRNMVTKDEVPKEALQEVIAFIEKQKIPMSKPIR